MIKVQQAEWDGYENSFHPTASTLQFGPFAPQFAAAQVTELVIKDALE